MPLKQSDAIEVKRVKGKGRGVFARRLIRKGEVIETRARDRPARRGGRRRLGPDELLLRVGPGPVALALGYGSLYNHSYRPNARYDDVGPQTKEFTALRDIEPGEEITVNYNGKPRSRTAVWFEVVEATAPAKAGRSSNGAAPSR